MFPPPSPMFCDHCGRPAAVAGPEYRHFTHTDGFWSCMSLPFYGRPIVRVDGRDLFSKFAAVPVGPPATVERQPATVPDDAPGTVATPDTDGATS